MKEVVGGREAAVKGMNREVQQVKERMREQNHGLGGEGAGARKQQRSIKVRGGG